MEFSYYLKTCRRRYRLTQEELVAELYAEDPELFRGLDASKLSKWERGVSQTSFQKMAAILRLFQRHSGHPLPCLEVRTPEAVERKLCEQAMQHLLGTPPKSLVVDLGMHRLQAEHFHILPLRQFDRMDELLELHQNLHENLAPPHDRLSLEQLREWALHPESLFYVVLYKHTFLGLFFALRLRPERFEALMDFSLARPQLRTEDLARAGDEASILLLSLFALDSRVATLLLMRLYAHLIAHQDRIRELGLSTSLTEIERLVDRMELRVYRSRKVGELTHVSYRNDLFNLLSNETAMRLLFPKESCQGSSPSPDDRSNDRSDGSV
jgi:transcriptional regulator with XRE-family HTH domain